MSYKSYVLDEIGRKHPRKNLYLLSLSQGEKVSGDHPYQAQLKAYEAAEKKLEAQVKADLAKDPGPAFDKPLLKKLHDRLVRAQKMVAFYEKHVDLTYDAEYHYKVMSHEISQIPEILENEDRLKAELKEKEKLLAAASQAEVEKAEKEIAEKSAQRKTRYEKDLADLEGQFKSGSISAKAFKNEKEVLKKGLTTDLEDLTFLNPKKSLEDQIRSIKHHQKYDALSSLKVLNADISDVRSKTPVEVEKTRPINALVSFLLPGLGQILNGQHIKALLFFLGSIFIYGAAIPYALGYGNYQGEGVAGLISLAEGGAKLDRSILFMIEGIIALIFLAIGAIILIASARDVHKVERGLIDGVRPKTWLESKQTIMTDGFPYLITTPALVVIVFIVMVPIFTAILISFTNMDPDHQNKFNWIGLDNYISIATGRGVAGGPFWRILGWTLIWTLSASSLAIVIGFVLALLVNGKRVRGKKFFRTVYLLPWAIPAFITIMFFSIMMSRNGIIPNTIESLFGVTLDIKNSTLQTRVALVLLQGWLGNAYIFLLSTGVMQGIPDDLYEAASIDGATGIQSTLRITIPLVLFQIAPILINQYTFNFNNFSIIYLFNQGGPFQPTVYGNLSGGSDILISYIYKLTMENQYQGIGAAITMFISVVIMFISFLGFRNTAAFKED